jgi:hypothetical protein
VYGAPGTATALALGAALAFTVAGAPGTATALALGFALAFTATPLLQVNLPLFFTQVYFKPPVMLISPAFLQTAPALTDADDPGATTTDRTKARAKTIKVFFISKVYWNSR